jgi:hypothetical protein
MIGGGIVRGQTVRRHDVRNNLSDTDPISDTEAAVYERESE